jgi:carboxypeptidase-like protein
MRTRHVGGAALALVAVMTASGAAQNAMVSGTVLRDSAGHPLAAAEISLPALNRRVTANWAGEFIMGKVPAGRYAIVIRHVGFAPLADTVDVAPGARVDRDYVLVEQAVPLEQVRVTAPERKYISPGLQAFEERRKAGFGHFIDETEMRKNDQRRLIDVIVGQMPGITMFRVSAEGSTQAQYISSGRKCGAGPAFLSCRSGAEKCPVTMYLDGALIFDAVHDLSNMPDLSRYYTRDYAAVEYYSGGASTPIQYNATSSGCGVLLLWTRER